MASAAAAKKWPRLFQCWICSTSPAEGTPRGQEPWPRASGLASPGPALRRQFAQLVVNQRHQLLRGMRVAVFDSDQNAGQITHELHHVGLCWACVAL